MPLLMFPEAQAHKITPIGQLTDRCGFIATEVWSFTVKWDDTGATENGRWRNMVDPKEKPKAFFFFLWKRKHEFPWKNLLFRWHWKIAMYRIHLSPNNMQWMYLNSSISSLNFIWYISPECNREKCLINILSNNTLSKSQIPLICFAQKIIYTQTHNIASY